MFVIDDIVTSFSDRISSHRSAWPRMQRCMVESALGTETRLAFSNGSLVYDHDWLVSTPMEFTGEVFNLFGGYTEAVRDRIARVLDMPLHKIAALEQPLPDIEAILRPRAIKAEIDFTDAEWRRIGELKNASVMTHESLVGDMTRVVIGDSHSIVRYRAGSIVYRYDGLTLHRMLTNGIKTYLPDVWVEHLVIVAGNIDIRHHLCRQADPIASGIALVRELREQLEFLEESGRVGGYEVTAPYPIEFEGRRLPKTGYYKGTPFYGSREQRVTVLNAMISEMRDSFKTVWQWPGEWYDMDPELYAKTYMEKPGSVHLSPEFYEWNLVDNTERHAMISGAF